ncbi:MAG: hypothetical protein RL318_769 [Fibrobacterota bacterium]
MILDTTLREGLQRVGVYLDLAGRIEVARALLQAGIPELEIGVVGRDGTVPALLEALRHEFPQARLWVWARMRREDVEAAARMGATHVALCAPTSEKHLDVRMGMTASELPDLVTNVVSHARALGLEVSMGMEDASRATREDLWLAAQAARRAGARRVRLADTVGVLAPNEVAELVLFLRQTGLEVGFHGHDDFGMATANALAALDAGAVAVDTTLLGAGERAGIAATERLGAYLSVRRGAAFDLRALSHAAHEFADAAKVAIPPHAPVVGSRIFACETGLHVAALSKVPDLYEPFSPEAVGAERDLRVGAKSGIAAIGQILSNLGSDRPVTEDLVRQVRSTSELLGRPLERGELMTLVQVA